MLVACAQGVQENMPEGDDSVDLGGSGGAGQGGASTFNQSGSTGSAGTASSTAGTSSVGGSGVGGASGSTGASGSAGKAGSSAGGTSAGGTSAGGSAGTSASGGKAGTSSGGTSSGGTSSGAGTSSGGSVSGGNAGTSASGGSGGSVSGNGVTVQYRVVTADAMTPYIQCELYVKNAGPNTFAVSDLKVRYYFTDDVRMPTTFSLNFSHIATSGANQDLSVTETSMAMVPTAPTADTYLEFSFSSSHSTLAAGETLDFSWRYNPTNQNFSFNQTNDYTFDATKTNPTDWSHVVAFQNGTVIWGAVP
jgi:endoglucanase